MSAIPATWWKEIRAVLPIWLACLTALADAAVSRERLLLDPAIAAFVVGPLAMGAHAFGHEYAHGTLPALLAQPIDRRALYWRKFLVSAVLVSTFTAIAWPLMRQSLSAAGGPFSAMTVQVLPVAGGLFAAPWLTMTCRSSLGGVLMGATIAGLSMMAAIAAAALWLRVPAETAQAVILGPWSVAMLALCALAGMLGVRHFLHVETIEGSSSLLDLPRHLAGGQAVHPRHPVRALAAKELHLQQLPLAIGALFLCGSVVFSLAQRVVPLWSEGPTGAVTLLYCLCLAIVIGAVASAEERQQGTLEPQMLQPTPAWLQWLVKVGVCFGLAALLGAALPVVLDVLAPSGDLRLARVWVDVLIGAVMLTAGSLYISSFSPSGVRAMVLTLPAGVACVMFIRFVIRWFPPASTADPGAIASAFERALLVGVMPPLVWFAFVNHRSSEHPPRRIVQQTASIAILVAIAIAAAHRLTAR